MSSPKRFSATDAIWAGLLLRLFVAIWNGFFGPSLWAEGDAASFHSDAVTYANSLDTDGIRGGIYAYALGLIYHLTTESLFLGSLLSCVVWLASASLLTKIMRLLSFDRSNQVKAMLIYALLPSSIFLTSVTLREVYQLLFINLAVYSALKIYSGKSYAHWLLLFCAATGMAVLHGALFAFAVYIVIATLILLALRGRADIFFARLIFITPVLALIVFNGFSLFTNIFKYNIEGGLAQGVQLHQQNLLMLEARTNYKDIVEIKEGMGIILFIIISFLQYLFEPMPWRISAVTDIEVLFENILRAWLIWKTCIGLRNMPEQDRRQVLFVFISYLIIEIVWSLGVINWGTAIRHHIPSIGLLLISAFAFTSKPLTNRCSRSKLVSSKVMVG